MTTFFNDLWKKLQPPVTQKDWGETAVTEKVQSPAETPKDPDEILKAYHDTEVEAQQQPTLFSNLKALKEIVDRPKEKEPELRFTQMKQHLGNPESRETVRQERWQDKIRCPNCHSNHLKRLPALADHDAENHRYLCLACGSEFHDDTGTPMEQGIPPVNVWMMCWYLMGCTDSLTYIAAKLNLELAVVEIMVQQLKKTFNAEKPLTRFQDFKEWSKHAKGLLKQLQEDLIQQYERLNANIATMPKDSTEFRRQQNLRRTLDSSTNPTPATPGSKRRT